MSKKKVGRPLNLHRGKLKKCLYCKAAVHPPRRKFCCDECAHAYHTEIRGKANDVIREAMEKVRFRAWVRDEIIKQLAEAIDEEYKKTGH